jgi:hypothetical protein
MDVNEFAAIISSGEEVYIIDSEEVKQCKLLLIEDKGKVSLMSDSNGDVKPVNTFYTEEEAAYEELRRKFQNEATEITVKMKKLDRLMENF